MSDVQNQKPEFELPLKVGVTNARKSIHIDRDDPYELFVTITAETQLNKDQRGAHMSRFLEAIDELPETYGSLEEFTSKLASELELRHRNSCAVTCESEFPYPLERPSGEVETHVYPITVKALTNGKLQLTVSAEAMTACPCVQSETGDITHNQRAKGTATIEYSPKSGFELIPAGRIVDVFNQSFSSPIYSTLKREEELEMVKHAHGNCVFCEDVARNTINLLSQFEELKDRPVRVEIVSYESIHNHDVTATWQGRI